MAELKTSYRMYADVKRENIGKIVAKAKQNDTKTRYFDITVTDNGTPVDLTDCEVRIYGRKHDGTEFYNNGSLQDPVNGRCLFEATTQMLALAAQDVHCEVVVYKNNEQILSTMPFTIHVVKSLIGESAIESSNEYGALVVLYQNLYEAIDLMTMMVKNFGEAGETAAQVPAETFWEMLESLYSVNKSALELGSLSGVLEAIKGISHGFYAEMVKSTDYASILPVDLVGGTTIVYNNEIHKIGSAASGQYSSHYKWDGTTWKWVGLLPYVYAGEGCAVVYNDCIHIIGGTVANSATKKHYRWDGTKWEKLTDAPANGLWGAAVVYDNKLHFFGGSSSKGHYTWDGTTWETLEETPYTTGMVCAVVYNHEIHLLGNYDTNYRRYHYKWNGTSWTKVSTLPAVFANSSESSAVVYQNAIYYIAGQYCYKWDGTSWISAGSSKTDGHGNAVVVFDNVLHRVEGTTNGHYCIGVSCIFTAYLLAGTKIYHDDALINNPKTKEISTECCEILETGRINLYFTEEDPVFLIA